MKFLGISSVWVIVSLVGCATLPAPVKSVDLSDQSIVARISELEMGTGRWPVADWWQTYQDPALNQLINLALQFSPSLRIAQTRFDAARQAVRIAGTESGGRVDATGAFDRQRLSDNGLFPPRLLGFNWYNQADLGLKASYTFDWWGKQRDSIGAALDAAHAAEADRAAAALVLASSVAETYFSWTADQSRLEILRARLALAERGASIEAARVRADLSFGDSVQQSALEVAAFQEQVAVLESSARLRIVTLAALCGQPIAELPALKVGPLPAIVAQLPESVRIDLMARRPDITASRWRVEASEKNAMAARAEFFPDVSLNGLLGLSSLKLGKLLEVGSGVPLIGGAVHLPIFDAGRLRARYGATQGSVNSAIASYQDTLIKAVQDVAIQVEMRKQVALQKIARQQATDAALEMSKSAAARVRQGITDLRPELTATNAWLVQRDALLQLDAAALLADIGLQRALGGGYHE